MSSEDPGNRFAIQSIHMDHGTFEIAYYDRETKHEHTAKGFSSLIPFRDIEGWPEIWDRFIEVVRNQSFLAVQEIGQPYPEALVDPKTGAEVRFDD